ncbi:LysR family transcriptional regulator [Beijerinckia sp. L45]|uniref:LysR family transcriptional regulator n=1 Tax=Beijerinckia sp. L45 TaxID=1641855 RepID=UPI00131CF243|nr:LysR family transcriptional regulator [Beijerinckia sp. L45]
MNFVAFKYFNEVAKTKSIRRAADRLHIAPSAVSRQLVQLEHSLGALLVERTNVGIMLTPAGEMVERYTLGMFNDLERLQASIKDFKGLQEGEVKLCVMDGIVSGFLPRVISEFNAQYPAINFTVTSDSTDRMIEALIRNEADIAAVYNSRPRDEIEVVAEHVEPVVCLLSKDHPLANRASLSLAEICDVPVALPLGSFGLRQIFDRAIAARKLSARVMLSTNKLELTRGIALAGRAVTIGPRLSAMREIQEGLLKAVPIEEPEFAGAKSTICVHRERPLSYAATEFLKKIAKEFAMIGDIDYSGVPQVERP